MKNNFSKKAEALRELALSAPDRYTAQVAEATARVYSTLGRDLTESVMNTPTCQPSGRRMAGLRARCESFLRDNPAARLHVRALGKRIARLPETSFSTEEQAEIRAASSGELPGAVSPRVDVAEAVLNLMSEYGAWATLGSVILETGKTKLAKVTAAAEGYILTSANRGTAITADASISGGSEQTDTPTIASLIEASREVAEDGRFSFEGGLMEAIVTGLNHRLDWVCFRADGTNDTTDGGITGIFAHGDVPVYNAAAGNDSVAELEFADFAGAIGEVSASALQRECRWWSNPSFIPKLLQLKDGNEKILKTPASAGGDWMLAGFPVTWSAIAPATDSPGQPIAAFGRGECYAVALRQQLELTRSEHLGFASLKVHFRALLRAEGVMRDADSFAILKTAAS